MQVSERISSGREALMAAAFSLFFFRPQREVVPSTRLATIPPAFGIRTLPAQATEYTFAYIHVPEDVSVPQQQQHHHHQSFGGSACRVAPDLAAL